MPLAVFNSLTRLKEEFKPIEKGRIRMYLCGPTVYGPGHIGHARTYVAFDIIRKYLEFSGFKVDFVTNFTDIHDDMIKKANELHTTIFRLADENIALFYKDMDALGIKRSTHYPRVTEHIPEIIAMVKTLEENGFAYETTDGVYFKVEKFQDYGRLSGIDTSEAKTGTRVETDKYEKEAVHDFALWKKAKPGEPFWDSPWGKGRPGWHIECSAMSMKLLGEHLDIHAGAVDLVFPHHENEICQSEAFSGKKPFVRYWLHSGFLNVRGQKMSKSLGNFIIIPELLEKFDPKVFRFFVSRLHYRSPIDFNEKQMEQEKKTLERLNDFIARLQEVSMQKGESDAGAEKLVAEARKGFAEAMDDDFNLPNAWAKIFELEGNANRLLAEGKLGKNGAHAILSFLKEIDAVLGVFSFQRAGEKLPEEIGKLIAEREKARKDKNWKESDRLRLEAEKRGYLLSDTPDGTKWKRK
ncbi:MAG: cysteine--tRNA ligase [Candidatus Diapherotrites archaeon]|nr:cysteine--tRNA ligase [Candidatus Diapherotrites archaeon]